MSEDALSAVPDDDLAWCHDAVQDVSRTFAITIDLLEEPMSSYICVGYLMCRIADTVEDTAALAPGDKAALLRQYDRVLDPDDAFDGDDFAAALSPHLPAASTDDWAVVAESGRVLRTYEDLPAGARAAITPPTRELIQGMELFVDRHAGRGGIRIQSIEELEEYCYYVAGTVGHLITNLVARRAGDRGTDLRETAEEFGLLLQLVNIAKDVHADYVGENDVYLPAEWLAEVGVDQDDLLDADESAVASVVERTAERARSYLDDAQSYLVTLAGVDRNAFVSWTVPFLLAVGTLRELSHRPEDALTPAGVKMSREEVLAVTAAAATDADASSLSALRAAVGRGEYADDPFGSPAGESTN